jgi:hypothetical protein
VGRGSLTLDAQRSLLHEGDEGREVRAASMKRFSWARGAGGVERCLCGARPGQASSGDGEARRPSRVLADERRRGEDARNPMDLLRSCAGGDGLHEGRRRSRQALARAAAARPSTGAVCTPESGTLRGLPLWAATSHFPHASLRMREKQVTLRHDEHTLGPRRRRRRPPELGLILLLALCQRRLLL